MINSALQRPWPRRLRGLFSATPFAQPVDLRGKRVIVTGASPGSIGFATARTLAAWGAAVVITTRTQPQAALAGLQGAGEIRAYALDLGRADSVARFADWVEVAHRGRLDVLINNAGVHLDLLRQWKAPQLSPDGYEIHWRNNYLGTWHLSQRLLPLLRAGAAQAGEARVVNVVSMLHRLGTNAGLFQPPLPYNSWVAYGLSKLALVHATFELQRRYAAEGVQACCLHPGAVYSNIAARGLEGSRAIGALRNALAPLERFFLLTPEEGAQTQIHCASQPQLAGGLYYEKCRPAPASAEALDTQAAARLWDETEAWAKTLG